MFIQPESRATSYLFIRPAGLQAGGSVGGGLVGGGLVGGGLVGGGLVGGGLVGGGLVGGVGILHLRLRILVSSMPQSQE